MGPPMYTVSGQIAQANRVAEPVNVTDVDDAYDTGENGNSENVTEIIVVKRTRSATNGVVTKKTRVYSNPPSSILSLMKMLFI